MSRVGPLLALAIGATVLPPQARAQDAAQLRSRAARLTEAFLRAQTLRAQSDTAASRRQPVDSVQVGALRLIVAPSMTAIARPAAETAWVALARTFGHAADVLEHTPLVVQVEGQPEGPLPALAPARQVFAPTPPDAAVLARGLVMQGAQVVGM